MTYGKKADGTFVLELTPDENEQLVRGYPLVKDIGDAIGDFTITVRLQRKGMRRPYPKSVKELK